MKNDKYLEFWINEEIFIQEIQILKKYEFFRKAIQINTEFEIDKYLIPIAFQIENLKYGEYGFEESCQIYGFLKYIMADNFEIITNEIIYHYKPCIDFNNKERDDYEKILTMDKEIYGDLVGRFMDNYMKKINKTIEIKLQNYNLDSLHRYNYDINYIKI